MIRVLLAVLAFLALSTGEVRAQAASLVSTPLIDGVTVGVGLNVYHGEMDSNPNHHLVKYVGNGQLNVLVGLDRRFGAAGVGVEAQYNHVRGHSAAGQLTSHLASLDATASYGGRVRVFVSAGPTLLVPRYQNVSTNSGELLLRGPHVLGTVTAGVILDDRVRLGVRLFGTDYVDGVKNPSNNWDYLSFVNLSYRFGSGE